MMKPKFNDPKQQVLWYLPYYGSAIAAVITIVLYETQLISMAVLIAIITVILAIYAALLWWAYRTRRMQIESEIIDEAKKSNAVGFQNDNEARRRINIYNIKVHNSSNKVIMEVVTVLLLLVAWGILWSQGWENIFSTLVMTVASVGALITTHFPFMMSDAEKHEDMTQVSLAVKKQQIYALIFAVMAVFSPVLKLQWNVIELLVVYVLVEAYFSCNNKLEATLDQQDKAFTGERFDSSDIQVERNMETIALEVVTGLLILIALCVTVLSYDFIKNDWMRYSIRIIVILGTAYLAINQLVKAVKYAKADKDLKNIRQFSLTVCENRVYGVEFALTSLIAAISIKHHIIDVSVFLIALLVMFFGTYFIFKYLIDKASSYETDE